LANSQINFCRRIEVKRIGEKLRILRQLQGLTTRQLAEEIETSNSYITQLEKGKRTPSTNLVLRISQFFNVSIDRLMKDELELDE
jgi:transcriptional regulator with XRE-family HTH domain